MEYRNCSNGVLPLMVMVLTVLISNVLYADSCIDESQMPSTTPDDRFDDLSNGTIRDKITGLMWKKCIRGRSGIDCAVGEAVKKTWQEALQEAESESFAEKTDWRLPNKNELFSIVENRCASPSINRTVFPNAAGSGLEEQWTSTHWYGHDNSLQAIAVHFRNGTAIKTNAGNINAFRLVRGGR